MGGICTSFSNAVDIEKQAKAFSTAIRDAEQNRKFQEVMHDKEQARVDKRKQNDKEAKRVLKEERNRDARDQLVADFEAPKTGRRTSREHHDAPKSSRRASADVPSRKGSTDVTSRRHSHHHDYDSSVASKKATGRAHHDDDWTRASSSQHSHGNRRASVGYDGDYGTADMTSDRCHDHCEDEDRRHSADDYTSSLGHRSRKHNKKEHRVVTASTQRGTVISTQRDGHRLRRSSTATIQGNGEKDGDREPDRKLVKKASSFSLQQHPENKAGLLGALGMDISFRRNSVHKKVTGKELAWLGQMDTTFCNDRDPNKSETLKALDREIHKATAGFFHSM